MNNKRICAIDISPNRIGLALSDITGTFVSKSFLITESFTEHLQQIYQEYSPIHTYIGLPINLDGSISEQTRYVKHFVHNNRQILNPFTYKDERYTTKLAKIKFPDSKKSTDELVAEILLSYEIAKNNK
jgi:putative Holliday junction resolvase